MKVWSDNRIPDVEHPGRFVIDPMWHLDEEHSQLATARDHFSHPGEGVIIGHLDNGLEGRHSAAPMRLTRGDWRANPVGLLEYAQKRSRGERVQPPPAPELTGESHGLGTAGILAGSWVSMDEKTVTGGRIKQYSGWLGGAPFAKVVPVRVAPWVVSIGTAELAYGIDYASRVKGADVITMSHGGSPTQAWVDAINAAYERGTAMFAAESDFFSLMPDPIPPNGIIVPASPVYPAGFRRVMGVTGVTADHRSYARNTLSRLLSSPFALLRWMSRGSYGADGTSTVFFRPSRKPDPSQTWRQGELRPFPIAAYSPNIPWLSIRKDHGHQVADGVDLDGAGTSAATPQVAAAAALWLQKHRDEFSQKEWHQWRKSEAVYYALLKSADRRGKMGPDRYLGAGLLRANDALAISYSEMKRERRPPGYIDADHIPTGSLWFEKTGNDYFDGARSLFSLFGLQSLRHVDRSDRASLRQRPGKRENERAALQRLYYNMMLLREWHGGDIPRKGKDEDMYWRRAGRKADKAQF
jgi:subtilisin family serine protease